MKTTRTLAGLFAALATSAVLTGCYTGTGGYDRGPYDPADRDGGYDRQISDLRGTVDRVDARGHFLLVTPEGSYDQYNLRNDRGDHRGDVPGTRQVYVYYDESTRVDYQGRSFRPEDLEAGDRIAANVSDRDSDRLVARSIQVLYDVSSNGNGTYRNDPYGSNGGYRSDNDDRSRDQNRYDSSLTSVRGIVRYIDTSNHTVEVDRSGRAGDDLSASAASATGDVVLVHYNDSTVVSYQGRSYSPENLERGDEVQIDLQQGRGGPGNNWLLAQQIQVIANSRSGR